MDNNQRFKVSVLWKSEMSRASSSMLVEMQLQFWKVNIVQQMFEMILLTTTVSIKSKVAIPGV